MNLREIKRSVKVLKPRELVNLDVWLRTLLRTRESERRERRRIKQGEILAAHRTTHKTYRLEGVRCGKQGCKCSEGELHGPYWYAYWTEGGRTKSQYVGKQLPKSVARRLSARGVR